jgi:hypothetical protein
MIDGPPTPIVTRFRLLGHAPCGWRYWIREGDAFDPHECPEPGGDVVPLVELRAVSASMWTTHRPPEAP